MLFKVTFWSPSWWSGSQPLSSGHVNSPSQKSHQQNCQGPFFQGHTEGPVFMLKCLSILPKTKRGFIQRVNVFRTFPAQNFNWTPPIAFWNLNTFSWYPSLWCFPQFFALYKLATAMGRYRLGGMKGMIRRWKFWRTVVSKMFVFDDPTSLEKMMHQNWFFWWVLFSTGSWNHTDYTL